jgi:hypothetical protein
MSLKDALMNAKKAATKVVEKKKEKKQVKQFKESVLIDGGTSVYTAVINGKKVEVLISVHTDKSTYFPRYRFHYRNALGNRVYIKTLKMEHAQAVCDQIEEQKGKYKISGSFV